MHTKLLLALTFIIGIVGVLVLNPDGVSKLIRSWNPSAPHIERAQAPSAGSFPDSHQIAGVPWISHEQAYCSPTALMMIGHSLGFEQKLGFFSLLMGFTYSAFYCPDCEFSLPWVFPSPLDGFAIAAPYLGLQMRHFGTSSSEVFLDSVRFHLSRGRPVIVNLDGSRMLGRPGVYPHTELLVGYDQSGFSYLETQIAPGQDPLGTRLFMSATELADSVSVYSEHFRHPFKYMFIIFEPAELLEDLRMVWRRAGSGLIGQASGRVLSGSYALEAVAADLEQGTLDLVQIEAFLQELIYTRRHNAEFLQAFDAASPQLLDAAQLLWQASDMYSLILESLGAEHTAAGDSLDQLIRDAAQAERSAGEILKERKGNDT